jgi:regulator of nucleoside diphosphate kinase
MAKRTQRNGFSGNGAVAERAIYIADDDRARLDALIRRVLDHPGLQATHGYLAALAGELRRARVVPRAEIPRDVVTMNSTVRLRDLETEEDETYTLVYPDDADIEANKISVLAPVGTALLGYRAGDVVEWPVPAGVARLRVEEVIFQPASARAAAQG